MIALINIDPFEILETYGGMPDPVVWPDGSASHGIEAGFVRGNCAIVECIYDTPAPSPFHAETSVTASFDGKNVVYRQEWQGDLDRCKLVLTRSIDQNAEAVRLHYLTPGFGQAMTYMQKAAEAASYLDGSGLEFPLLTASIGIHGADLREVAVLINDRATKWNELSAKIEAVRLSSKKKIADAASIDEVRSIHDAIVWP